MENEHDIQIKAAQEKITVIAMQMETVYQEILQATNHFVSGWYKTKLDTIVRNNSDWVQKSHADGTLSNHKSELQRFIDNAHLIVNKYLTNEALWSHKTAQTTAPSDSPSIYSADSLKLPSNFSKTFQSILEHSSDDVLIKVGLKDAPKGYYQPDSTLISQNRKPYTISGEMADALNRYNSLNDQLKQHWSDLSEALYDKARHEAQNLWDQA